ncbi:MAG: nucleotidyltransferase domain-containing protein [Cyclobacteriaceae bacterium]|nr:nucleotidyltransferase domain-containing protein [Cyclobacteriaceae bacterium]
MIKKHKEEIRQLSTKYKVSKLYAFGSVLTERFNTKSDIDFLVHFSGVPLLDHFDNYMNFKEHLELLLSRNVDLVEVQTVKNPILKRSINQTKTLIYDRKRDTQMAI